MGMENNRFFPIWLLLLIGMIAISFSSIFVKWSEAPVSVIVMYRLFLTNVMLLPFIVPYRAELLAITWKQGLQLFGSGLALGLHFYYWMASLQFTTVASSTVILTMEPIMVAVGSYWVFGHMLNRLAKISMAVAIIGAVVIGWGDFGLSASALKGDVLSLIGTVAVAFHMLLGKSMRASMSAFVYSFSVFLIAGLVMLMFNVVSGVPIIGYPAQEWGNFLLLAIVPTVFGHFLFNWLLKYVSATTVSMTVLGEPVGATILAWFLLGERIGWLQGLACGIMLFGVWLFMRSSVPVREESRRSGHAA